MRASECLRCVTCGCIFVSYGPRYRAPKSRTPQPCTRTAAAVPASARCRRADGQQLRSLSSSGLSLSPASPASQATGSRRRRQDRLYRQALPGIGSATSLLRKHDRPVVERNRQQSDTRGLAAETKAWLSGSHRATMLFILNIASIVCLSRNWSKSTNFSFPRYVGRWDRQN